MTEKKQHWETIYSTKTPDKMSWTQPRPSPSIDWILEAVPDRNSSVIDIGGGISLLVDHLLEAGYKRPAVLDISGAALTTAKNRLGARANSVDWLEADVTTFNRSRKFSVWHDRAVFHFLTTKSDRDLYLSSLKKSLEPQAHVVIATFALDGPQKCSGIEVMRYSEKTLSAELGPSFKLIRSESRTHQTPWGTDQAFVYCLFQT